MDVIDEKSIKSLLEHQRSRAAEYHYLRSRQKKHKILTQEQLKQMNDLEDWLACIDSMLRSLSDDERFVIQRHLVDGIDWNRIIAEYETKWGAQNGRCRRTLIRYQNSALTKLARRMQEADLPDIK